MTIVRIGSTKKFSDGWDKAFGKAKGTAKKSGAKPSASAAKTKPAKPAKKKSVQKAAKKKKA